MVQPKILRVAILFAVLILIKSNAFSQDPTGGYALLVQNGKPIFYYNFLGIERFTVTSSKPLPKGTSTIRFDFAYDGGGIGKGGTGTLLVNGKKVGELATAGAISVNAQTPAVAESSPATVAANASTPTDPKKTDVAKPTLATSEKRGADKTSEIHSDNSTTDALGTIRTAGTTRTRSPSAAEDQWQFVFSPYFWMAGVHGTTGGPNRTVQVDESFGDIFGSLKFAFMGVFEAHKNKWAIQTDVEFVSLEDDKATPGPLFSSANAKIKTFVFTPEVGYRIYDDPDKGSFVQVLGGTRIWHISTDLNFGAGILPAVEIKSSRSWVDGVVGLRGKAALSEKFFFMGRFDVGGGGSKFTYQVFGGLGYNVNKKIALVGGYRALDVNYDKNNFLYDTNQRGLIMGIGFKF